MILKTLDRGSTEYFISFPLSRGKLPSAYSNFLLYEKGSTAVS